MDVEVVIGVLLDAAERLELRQHDRGRAEAVEKLQPTDGIWSGDEQAKLRELALTGGIRRPLGCCSSQLDRPRLELELHGRGESCRSQNAEGVVREAPLGRGPKKPGV